MPITEFQTGILRLLAQNRSPSSYVAGGSLSSIEGRRYSEDIDYFHDNSDLTLWTFNQDLAALEAAGYTVSPVGRPMPGFVRAVVQRDGVAVKVDWAHEAAWHFFQPIKDENLGYRLHWADAATNKVLAFASRREPRDVFDTLQWHEKRLNLGALIWAASGKDAGLPPGMILDEIRRKARITPADLAQLQVEGEIDPVDFSARLRNAISEAETLIQNLPPDTAGCLFLDPNGEIICPDPSKSETTSRPLAAQEGGLVPAVSEKDSEPN